MSGNNTAIAIAYPPGLVNEYMSMIEHQTNRIATLEHALDQALLVIADVREQLKEQHILEAQLAKTEEFANIQQQAIASLQAQLRDAQQEVSQNTTLKESYNKAIAQVQDDFILTAQKKAELEHQIEQLTRREGQLQHQCLELTEYSNEQSDRIQVLENQIHDLQEQVLQQVQQLREQETATQHWRGRYQMMAAQLTALLEPTRQKSVTQSELEKIVALLK